VTDTTAATLRDLALSASTIPVIDDLAGLEACLPDMPDELERHAALLERLPPILELRGRALVHAQQYQRFLNLAEIEPSALEDRIDTANALAILAHAGEIAMLLVPAGSPQDRFAKACLARERREQYRFGVGVHDPDLMRRAVSKIVPRDGSRLVLGQRMLPGMEDAGRRFSGAVLPDTGASDGDGPSPHRLEDALSLEDWFNNPPDLGGLLEEVRALLARIETWPEEEDYTPFRYGAQRGAQVLAYARLCRIGLWPARNREDLVTKMEVERLVSQRDQDPDVMRALVEIALGVGRRIARQGLPFVTCLGGVEL
jgi:hypothetical protein